MPSKPTHRLALTGEKLAADPSLSLYKAATSSGYAHLTAKDPAKNGISYESAVGAYLEQSGSKQSLHQLAHESIRNGIKLAPPAQQAALGIALLNKLDQNPDQQDPAQAQVATLELQRYRCRQ